MFENVVRHDQFLVQLLGFLLPIWQNHSVMLRETVRLGCSQCPLILSPYAQSCDPRIIVALIFGSVQSTNSMPAGFSAHAIINMLTRLHIDAFQESDSQWQRLEDSLHRFYLNSQTGVLFHDAEASPLELTQIARLGAGSTIHTDSFGSVISDRQFSPTEIALLRRILAQPRDFQLFEFARRIAWTQHADLASTTSQYSTSHAPGILKADVEPLSPIHLELELDILFDVSDDTMSDQENNPEGPQSSITSVAIASGPEDQDTRIDEKAVSIYSTSSESASLRSFRRLAERIARSKQNRQSRGSFSSICMSPEPTSSEGFGLITGYGSDQAASDEQFGVRPASVMAEA